MADYTFYTGTYLGDSITEGQFPRLCARAEAQLARYRRIYRVRVPNEKSEDMALCAMADAIFYFETAAGEATSSSVGSVSSSHEAVDASPKAQSRELYRCASLYLDIYRGCGPC